MSRILVIDNYDSFTWNLVHLIGPLVRSVDVVRNDEVSPAQITTLAPDAIVLSPGPCTPNEAGISLDVVREVSPFIPTLGVCLGLQTIGQAFGGRVVRAPEPRHGKVDVIVHEGKSLFAGIEGSFRATRYHSLVVDRPTCPPALAITAETGDGLIMALSHAGLPIHGVQFHPESISSEHGARIMRNFLRLAGLATASGTQARHHASAAPANCEGDRAGPAVH